MLAVVVEHRDQLGLQLTEVPEPHQGDHDVLIEVAFIALNPGELKSLSQYSNGSRIGWDFAGTVLRAAPDGTGPQAGARVVGTTRRGGWAERFSSPTDYVARIPDNLEFDIAVCLPVPAMTAYVGLRCAGLLFRKRILVTGAAGAVGQFVCQIALSSGAAVSAAVRRDEQAALVASHGVRDVRITEGIKAFVGDDRFDLIVDVIGEGVAEDAAKLLVLGGVYVLVSAAGGECLPLPIPAMLSAAGQLRVINLFPDIERGPDSACEILSRLLASAAEGEITAPIGPQASWVDIDGIARSYLASSDRSKPVLRVHGASS